MPLRCHLGSLGGWSERIQQQPSLHVVPALLFPHRPRLRNLQAKPSKTKANSRQEQEGPLPQRGLIWQCALAFCTGFSKRSCIFNCRTATVLSLADSVAIVAR